jgi:hypothetical protein
MVDAVLGPAFYGVLVSDFYAACDHCLGPHQRCWAHLWREIRALTQLYPADASLTEWAEAVHTVYAAAKAHAADAHASVAAAMTGGRRESNPVTAAAAPVSVRAHS